MKTIFAAAAIVALSSVSAFATDDKAKSTADAPAASGQNPSADQKMSPGTTGAMQNVPGAAATSPGGVQEQGGAATAPKSTDQKAAPAGDMKK